MLGLYCKRIGIFGKNNSAAAVIKLIVWGLKIMMWEIIMIVCENNSVWDEIKEIVWELCKIQFDSVFSFLRWNVDINQASLTLFSFNCQV